MRLNFVVESIYLPLCCKNSRRGRRRTPSSHHFLTIARKDNMRMSQLVGHGRAQTQTSIDRHACTVIMIFGSQQEERALSMAHPTHFVYNLRGSATRFFTSGFSHQSALPDTLVITLATFRICTRICENTRSSGCPTGVDVSGGK